MNERANNPEPGILMDRQSDLRNLKNCALAGTIGGIALEVSAIVNNDLTLSIIGLVTTVGLAGIYSVAADRWHEQNDLIRAKNLYSRNKGNS